MKHNRERKLDNPSVRKILICLGLIFIILTAYFGGYFSYRALMGKGQKATDDVLSIMDKVGFVYDPEIDDYVTLEEDKIVRLIAGNFLDGYSSYYTKEEYEKISKQNSGDFSGFGIGMLKTDLNSEEEGTNKVALVSAGSPAYKGGIKQDDYIVKVSVTRNDVLEEIEIGNGKQLYEFLTSVSLNEEANFYIQREGVLLEAPISLTAKNFMVSYVSYFDSECSACFYYTKQDRVNSVSSAYSMLELSDVTEEQADYNLDETDAYIKLHEFHGDAVVQMAAILQLMQKRGKTDLILDLCDNGGGSMSVLTEIASYLIKNSNKNNYVIAVATEKLSSDGDMLDDKYDVRNFTIGKNNFQENIKKLTVLANKNTASASECLIGALCYYADEDEPFSRDNLIIVKSEDEDKNPQYRTYGKGIMQTTYVLSSGGALKLTTAKLLWPDRETCIHKTGIEPYIEENRAENHSLAIERAVSLIQD